MCVFVGMAVLAGRYFLHSVRVSSVEVETRDGGRGVHVQFAGHAVQGGQPQVDAAHGQHAGLEQVHVPVLVTGHLGRARGGILITKKTLNRHFPKGLLGLSRGDRQMLKH